MIYVRGVPLDFERWAQAGAEGWSWDEVLPYFRKAEKQQTHHDDLHGEDGPLNVQDVSDRRSVHDAFIRAMCEMGIPYNLDFNGQDQAGAGFYHFTQRNGKRWSTASAYLRDAKRRPNLRVMTHAHTQRITFEGRRATGVTVLRRGRMETYLARQVVLCGGAINSPQLLELSGVGDAGRLNRLGIPVVHNNPEVGENLQDHAFAKVVYGTHAETSINREVWGWRLVPTALKWLLKRDGPLTAGSAPVGGFWYTRKGLDAPDVQFHFASGATLYNQNGRIRPLTVPAMTGIANQSRPESRGCLHIESPNPLDKPTINANYLAAELDRQTLIAGVRQLVEMFEAPSMRAYVTRRISPAPGLDVASDGALLDYIRGDATTTYHPTSTCAIGKVVDSSLKVDGVERLFVADASVMPYVVSGNTNAATIMIAEKMADGLLADV